MHGSAAGNIDSVTTEGSPPKLIGKLENMTPVLIQKTLEHYEAQIIKAPIENAIIITRAGDIYHCTGDLNTLTNIEDLGEKLYGAYVTHNHPVGSVNDYTFSELDEKLFVNFKLVLLRGIDERFIYELNRNTVDNELAGHDLCEVYNMGFDLEDYHVAVMIWALINGFGYRRQLR